MIKYYVDQTKKSSSTILYITDTKEDAMAKGKEIYAQVGDSNGVICVCSADFDENNRRTDGRCKIYGGWRDK